MAQSTTRVHESQCSIRFTQGEIYACWYPSNSSQVNRCNPSLTNTLPYLPNIYPPSNSWAMHHCNMWHVAIVPRSGVSTLKASRLVTQGTRWLAVLDAATKVYDNTSCEDLFCYHLGKIMLLAAAKGDFADVKIDLGNSFMTLRQHTQEAHGGC